MQSSRTYNVLFVCTAGRVNPFALELLDRKHIQVSGRRSKSWDEFARPDAAQSGPASR